MILDLSALRQACQSGQHFEYLLFWGHQPSKDGSVTASCFSQWWVSPFTHEGSTYRTAEHWMMACKARLFRDDEALARILSTESPAAVKKIGREVRNFDGATWEQHKFAFVAQGNALKFAQHPDLMAFLLATGDKVIVEASPYDRIWGIGMGANHPDAQDPMKWRGQNLLGFALMKVRQDARR